MVSHCYRVRKYPQSETLLAYLSCYCLCYSYYFHYLQLTSLHSTCNHSVPFFNFNGMIYLDSQLFLRPHWLHLIPYTCHIDVKVFFFVLPCKIKTLYFLHFSHKRGDTKFPVLIS